MAVATVVEAAMAVTGVDSLEVVGVTAAMKVGVG